MEQISRESQGLLDPSTQNPVALLPTQSFSGGRAKQMWHRRLGLNQEKADEGVQAWSTAGQDPWVSVPKADIMSGSLRGPGSRSNPSLYRWANRPGTHPGSKDVKGRAGPRFRDSRPLCPKLLSPLPKHLPLLQ